MKIQALEKAPVDEPKKALIEVLFGEVGKIQQNSIPLSTEIALVRVKVETLCTEGLIDRDTCIKLETFLTHVAQLNREIDGLHSLVTQITGSNKDNVTSLAARASA